MATSDAWVASPAPPGLPERGGLVVVIPMPPSYRGGTEEYAYQVVRHCADEIPVHVVTTTVRWKDGADVLAIGSASLERLAAREFLERPLLVGPRARAELKRVIARAGVVQLHMPFPWVERRVTRWARDSRIPSVLTYHMDAEFGADPARWTSRMVMGSYRGISARPALTNCSVVVSNSMGYARASPVLSKFLPKVRVIYQGIDADRLRPAPGESGGAIPARRDGVARVVFIGRLVSYKGLPDLVRAIDQLRRSGRAVELLIGGKGPMRESLDRLVGDLGMTDIVRFLGFVPDSAVGALYSSADVVACPSTSLLESTPITLQEAMAFGTPVVGSTLPCTEESIPDDGVRGRLVAPHDVPALATALAQLIDAGRPTVPGAARSWKDTAHDYVRLFEEVRRSPPAG
ncbi:MAG TPA: glycosyltransferase [Thermoplasmata archaeon]|nr:glycosyltransferase [Thermoplasmata archaeon]